ncbi:hypothetical protein RN001_014882 [Aquatica leii]|uniref:L-lactate dehydrogenase n=1 Tax=Aquatica leii TaxID=1421715 RepID=A0AAN7QC52_9COLE|nr:hypothetical protein RN001_014882 [Aquatica leii]
MNFSLSLLLKKSINLQQPFLVCHLRFSSNSQIIRPFIKCNAEVPNSKISVIGLGNVGCALVATLLFMKLTNEIGFVDINAERLKANLLGFKYMSMHLNYAKIEGSTTYDAIAGSKICIFSAGVRPNPGESRLTILEKNVVVMKDVVPKVVRYAPDSILILVLNPVDIMTYITTCISGFPPERVLGSGTNLDTARLRFKMSEKYNVATDACEGWVLGEHGLSSMIAWSTCKVGGVFITDLNPKMGLDDDKEKWAEVHQYVTQQGPGINKLKGYTNWGIALSVCDICNAILNNTKSVRAVTVPAKGFHGIEDNVYLSLPAVIGQNGIIDIVELPLTERECQNLHKSGKFLFEYQQKLKI